MDLICPKCGEPFDVNAVQFGLFPAFTVEGCTALGRPGDYKHNDEPDLEAAEFAREVYALLGDDMDGCAAEFDDAGF